MRIIASILFGMFQALSFDVSASAGTIFESAVLGPTGVSWQQVIDGEVPTANIARFNYFGARFQVADRSITTRVGGHFLGGYDETSFFGAIVSLASSDDLPDSGNLSTPDVLGVTVMDFSSASAETTGNLVLKLEPGWYAVVFGTGLFGTTGRGFAPRNGEDINSPSYLVWQPDNGWFNYSTFSANLGPGNLRLFVEGTLVPEPTTGILLALAMFSVNGFIRGRRHDRLRVATPTLTAE